MDVKFPIGQLDVPEKVTLEDVQGWLEQIKTYTTRLRETVDSLNEDELGRKYREGSWDVRQLVHHIADSQLNMYQRLRLALTDNSPTVPGFDQDKWAVLPDTELPVEPSIKMLEGINERIVALGQSITDDQLERSFIHETNGEIKVSTKLRKLSWHQEHHLAHIKIALETLAD
ncbi:DinB superfamily protein [Bhargavaea ginsengi]|uniref:DinB superfamily protein n=1 Tax=Bhargavaea ginsengi TaxID=426757 RepID=A0A1H6V2V6_9BACL|nr:putative metal-dependent hydrolase [Bhargavaea ginsengi]SEI94585.1 DinB superfamily protein [Bhargavaea ginsengi]